jgi:hypothetical protein
MHLIAAFESIPEDWQPFIRVECPKLGIYQILNSKESSYQFVESEKCWMDIWDIRNMTDEEKSAKQQQVKNDWINRPFSHNFTAWVYDEESNLYKPPFLRPTDVPEGQMYRWSGIDNNWKLTSTIPHDGKSYYFDFDKWQYIEGILTKE